MRITVRLFAYLLASLSILVTTENALSQPAGSRTVIAMSDLHMGVGRDESGAWNPYEDFRWTNELLAFLEALDGTPGGIDLLLNGDTFELYQSTGSDCAYREPSLGCTEAESLSRLERVLAAHAEEIRALGEFSRSGSNRVVFVPGDHDAALLFPSVAQRLLAALGAPEGAAEVASSGYWISEDGLIYAEHGHQVGFNADRMEGWPAPFVERGDRTHLLRPWGKRTPQNLLNRLEPEYPVLDNLAEAGMGVRYALVADATVELGKDAWELLHYVLLKMTYQQFRLTDYTEGSPPVWDLAAIRAEGPSFLVESLAEDDPFKPLARRALEEGQLSGRMDELLDAELVAICDYHRGAVRRARRRMEPLNQFPEQGPAVPECPRTSDTTGPTFGYFWRSRDEAFARHLESVQTLLNGGQPPIAVFLRGHTHLPDRSRALYNDLVPEGFSPVRGSATPIIINSGAWQRTITPLQLDRLRGAEDRSLEDVLRNTHLEDLAPCYSFVLIEPYRGTPTPVVRYWRQTSPSDGEILARCGG